MPISLLPPNRREFIAASATLLIGSRLAGAESPPIAVQRFALLADTHIPAKSDIVSTGVNMTENLQKVVQQLTDAAARPLMAMIVGDCAHLKGEVEDYALLRETLSPLAKIDMPVYLALGNHDERENCAAAFPGVDQDLVTKVERRVTVVETKFANWFLLDSLEEVNKTPGKLGETQLKWLAEALDQHTDRPALICVHHNCMLEKGATEIKGLIDTDALFEVVVPRQHVKAMFYGHTHFWNLTKHEGIHLVNLPPVAYVFVKEKPSGWIDCLLAEDSATLTLQANDTKHSQHGESIRLAWR